MKLYEMFFNSMALAIRRIIDNTDEGFFEKYIALSSEERFKINGKLGKLFPEMIEDGHAVEVIDECSFEMSFFLKLENFILTCSDNSDLRLLVGLVTKLDIALSKRGEMQCFENTEIEGLNTNIDETDIHILPRVKCAWEHASRGRNHESNLLICLNNFYYIEGELISPYKVVHRFVKGMDFLEAKKRGTLKIGVSPLSDLGELQYTQSIADGCNQFDVQGVKNEDVIISNALGVLEKAGKQGVDILCMPEMLGTPELYQRFKGKLEEFPDGDDISYPSMVILPSIWSDNHNKLEVIDDLGICLASQEKQHSFPFGYMNEVYRENIEPDRVLHIIHCPGIGRIAIMICKDALIDKYLSMALSVLKVTLLFVPSYSTGVYPFETILNKCYVADCCAVWINTCSAQTLPDIKTENFEKIGLVVKAGKSSKKIRNGMFACEKTDDHCGKGKRSRCNECLFIEELLFNWG